MSLLIALLPLSAVTAARAEVAFQRWAVIASKPVVDSGLSDLLTARLSRDDSIELVERERLQEATRELQLATLMKADHVDERLRLGETLGADALMVLSIEQRPDRRVLRVVVCAAKLGVRLLHEELPYDEAKVKKLVEPCATTIAEVRQRFANGIRHIIAVPPFLSEDFEQRFDYLQSRHSEVLSGALTVRAGVAVVEIEEAQAILREQEDILAGGLGRPIATIVRGKYRVGPLNEENRRQIEVEVELVRGDRDREHIRKMFQLGTVGHWLVESVSKRVLGGSENEAPALSSEAQKAILARHAQRFAELGDWERSTSLREAALVLDPNDAVQRGLVIREYQFSVNHDIGYTWSKNLPPIEEHESTLRRAADDYCTAMQHLEYLVRNKLIKRNDAVGLFYTQRWCKDNAAVTLPDVREYFAALEPAWLAERRFVRDVYPDVIDLPGGRVLPERFNEPFYGWQYPVIHHVINDVCFHDYSAESLAGLKDLLVRVLPEDAGVSDRVLNLMRGGSAAGPPQLNRDQGEWVGFLTRLTLSDREVVKLYGHWGLLLASDEGTITLSRDRIEALPALIANVDRHLAEVKRLDRIGERALTSLELSLTMTKNRLRVATSPPPKPSTAGRSVVRESVGRMRFDPISLVVEGKPQFGQPPLITGMLQCGADCDAYWTKDQFFVMHQPGVLRELKLTESVADHSLYWGVTWDGECIWLYAYGQGIIALRPDGTRLATFKQREHLPGYWKGYQLLGLSPRRALMVGSFGETNRAWCGILEFDEHGKQSVDVFFEAKYVAQGRSPEEAAADPKTAFQPVRLHYLQSHDGKCYVLVERRDLTKFLRIDLDTLKVSVGNAPEASTRTDLGFRGRHFFHEGRLISALSPNLNKVNSLHLLFHEGWLYVPGRFVWLRLAPGETKPERLQPWPSQLPRRYWGLYSHTSAHYGLIGYQNSSHSRPLYQIKIVDETYDGDTQEVER